MTYRTIRDAQLAVWPAVQESLRRHKQSREALQYNPRPTTAALTRSRVPMDRVASNETVWALAKQNLLNTAAQADVITAAKAWARTTFEIQQGDLTDLEADELALYDAVQALATDPAEIPPEELLTPVRSLRTVSSNTQHN